jgi:hypothetical protein
VGLFASCFPTKTLYIYLSSPPYVLHAPFGEALLDYNLLYFCGCFFGLNVKQMNELWRNEFCVRVSSPCVSQSYP